MHGPYTATVRLRSGGEPLVLSEDDVRDGESVALRFYADGGVRTLVGFQRAAVFTTALLLSEGEEAEVEVIGLVGSGSRAERTGATFNRVRIDRGEVVSDLGSRFNERIFRGVR